VNIFKMNNNEVIGNVYVISDMHFFHEKIIEYADRPFKDIAEHNKIICKNWNETIGDGDTVFVLGDVGFGSNSRLKKLIGTLNGRKILIRGNHDRSHDTMLDIGFYKSVPNLMWKNYYMIHNCSRVGNELYKKSMKIILSGHSHSTLKYNLTNNGRKVVNVCVDAWQFKPVSLMEINKVCLW
jgi:calcineurin-like phosphoesterase family protein